MESNILHPNNTSNNVEIWTDGSCNWKNRRGGIGIYMKQGPNTLEYFEGFKNTSIGRMELAGILIALKLIKNKNNTFILYCDSQYAINCMNLWIDSWSDFQFVGKKNDDLLRELQNIKKQFKKITFCWVRGHNKNEGNELADLLANKGYTMPEENQIEDFGTTNISNYILK